MTMRQCRLQQSGIQMLPRSSAHSTSMRRDARPLSHRAELRSFVDRGKRKSGSLRDVQQRMVAIGEIQHPKPRVDLLSNCLAAARPVKVSLSKLRLTVWPQVAVATIVLKHVDDAQCIRGAMRPIGRPNEIEIVGRSMIFRETSPKHSASGSPRED